MATIQAKIEENIPQKTRRIFLWSQAMLRTAAFLASLASALIMVMNKQTVQLFGFQVHAKYMYTQAFRFLVIANFVSCAYSLLSLPVLVFLLNSMKYEQRRFFLVFLLDMMTMGLITAASSAATAIGFVARNGNSHTGWTAVCDNFGTFCSRSGYSIVCSYASLFLFFLITVLSATKPIPTPVSPC